MNNVGPGARSSGNASRLRAQAEDSAKTQDRVCLELHAIGRAQLMAVARDPPLLLIVAISFSYT